MEKPLSFLLAVYLGFLSIHVVVIEKSDSGVLKEKICTMKCSAEKMSTCETSPCEKPTAKNKTGCRLPNEGCSPCSSCTCVIYCFCGVVLSTSTSLDAHSGLITQYNSRNKVLVSDYHPDSFHPPEAV